MATCTWQWCDWTDKWLHEGGTQRFALCTGQPQNTIVCKVSSCGTVQIGKMYSILPVGLKYCLQVELPLSAEQEWGWLASNTVGTKHALTSTCQLTNDFFGTMCSVSNVPTMNKEDSSWSVWVYASYWNIFYATVVYMCGTMYATFCQLCHTHEQRGFGYAHNPTKFSTPQLCMYLYNIYVTVA